MEKSEEYYRLKNLEHKQFGEDIYVCFIYFYIENDDGHKTVEYPNQGFDFKVNVKQILKFAMGLTQKQLLLI